jgi:hypothetical protein
MPSPTYILFRKAILAEQQVTCTYDGRSRELCPHIVGTNKDGEEAVLAWQRVGRNSGAYSAVFSPMQDGAIRFAIAPYSPLHNRRDRKRPSSITV